MRPPIAPNNEIWGTSIHIPVATEDRPADRDYLDEHWNGNEKLEARLVTIPLHRGVADCR